MGNVRVLKVRGVAALNALAAIAPVALACVPALCAEAEPARCLEGQWGSFSYLSSFDVPSCHLANCKVEAKGAANAKNHGSEHCAKLRDKYDKAHVTLKNRGPQDPESRRLAAQQVMREAAGRARQKAAQERAVDGASAQRGAAAHVVAPVSPLSEEPARQPAMQAAAPPDVVAAEARKRRAKAEEDAAIARRAEQ